MTNAIAVRYAKALLDAADEMQKRPETDSSIALLASLFEETRELDALLMNSSRLPGAEMQISQYLIDRLVPQDLVRNLIRLLAERRRLNVLYEITQSYLNESRKRQGKLSAIVTSIRQLDPDETLRIQEKLNTLTRKEVEIVWKQDASLLGGIRIQIGDEILDGSLQQRLKQLQEHLIYG